MSTNSRVEISGNVGADLVPRIRLELHTPKRTFDDAILDTGFAGSIIVPNGTLTNLGLGANRIDLEQADGTIAPHPIEVGLVTWFGEQVEVALIEMGMDPMVGMGLLLSTRIEFGQTTVVLSRPK